MPHSNFLQKKATEFMIDLAKPADQGVLLVYKRALEGMRTEFRKDLLIITENYLKILNADLLAMYNDFDDMRDTPDAETYMKSGFITSVNAIMKHLEEAYKAVGVATKMLEDDENAKSYKSYLDSLFECREALRNSLKQFLISP